MAKDWFCCTVFRFIGADTLCVLLDIITHYKIVQWQTLTCHTVETSLMVRTYLEQHNDVIGRRTTACRIEKFAKLVLSSMKHGPLSLR
jgi:hypothetical protein